VLPRGTPDEVREEVRLRIRQFGPGGGFVAAAVHNIQPDVPAANILALSQAVHEFGGYPAGKCTACI
jgi:uroporphyrinogen decarboxylase